MDSERLRQIELLYHAALDADPAHRETLLREQCAGDDELRGQVERLLAMEKEPFGPLDRDIWQSKRLEPGTAISHYRIESMLGEGGTGVVYRALDTKLNRPVAVKFLSARVGDPTARQRFQREAQTASSLNHPHIVTVHDVGEFEGQQYLVTELLDGGTLRQWASRKRPWHEVVELLTGVADALATAHEAKILHRDVKPENILLTKSGYAELADFGLAKLYEGSRLPASTVTAVTRPGVIVGTPAYMSPEQASGAVLDGRSDIFSFGVVLYETLCGARPFSGTTELDLLHAIVHAEPGPLGGDVPTALCMVVEKALEKDCADRYQSMRELVVDLRRLTKRTEDSVPFETTNRPRRRIASLTAGIVIVTATLAAGGWIVFNRAKSLPELPPVFFTSLPGRVSSPSFSPDGNRVAFVWSGQLDNNYDIYVKQVGTNSLARLTSDPAPDLTPAWSPDDRFIAFVRGDPTSPMAEAKRISRWPGADGIQGSLILIPSIGGPERKLAERVLPGLSWTPDGRWLAAVLPGAPGEGSAIWLISSDSGEKHRLTQPRGRTADLRPSISPDGASLAFARVDDFFTARIYILPISRDGRATGVPQSLSMEKHASVSGITWMPDSRELVYSAGGATTERLWRTPVSGGRPPLRLDFAVQTALGVTISGLRRRLIYEWYQGNFNLARLDIRTGKQTGLALAHGQHLLPQYSRDGRRIAFESTRSGNLEIWTCDSEGANCLQLTSYGGPVVGTPTWSPDGRWLAYDARPEGVSQIYMIPSDGGTPRQLTAGGAMSRTPYWSHDGRWIYFCSDRSGNEEAWRIPRTGGPPTQITKVGGCVFPKESVDGRFLYYTKTLGLAGPLFRYPLDRGAEQQVLPRAISWDVTARGVYFADPDEIRAVKFQEFATGKVRTVGELERPPGLIGLAVSPDEAYVVASQIDHESSDLMLVENFR